MRYNEFKSNGIFCALGVSKKDTQILYDFTMKFNVEPVTDMHMTIFKYKKGNFDFNTIPKIILPVSLQVNLQDSFGFFSNPHLGIKQGVVLILKNDKQIKQWLIEIINTLREQGHKISKEYIERFDPHVSLSYQNIQSAKLPYPEAGREAVISSKKMLLKTEPPIEKITFDRLIIDKYEPKNI